MIFRLSQKLATKIKEGRLTSQPLHENPLADWSAQLFVADRTQYILLSNTQSLYSVVMFDKAITDDSQFIQRALSNIREFMEADGQAFACHRFIVPATEGVRFAQALDRSVTGVDERHDSACDLLAGSWRYVAIRHWLPAQRNPDVGTWQQRCKLRDAPRCVQGVGRRAGGLKEWRTQVPANREVTIASNSWKRSCLMKRCLLLLVLALATGFLPAQEKSVRPDINKPFENPDVKDFIGKFEGESREIYTLRNEIVAACKLKPGMAVADIGAGTGLFTRLFAKEVGDKGKVYAVEIAPKFIEHIEKTCKDAGIKNVTGVVCTADNVKLPANSIDVAFICDTYHHFEFPFRMMASIHEALRPGGQVIVIDFHRIEGKSREWVLGHVRAGQEVVVREITQSGFKLVGEEKLPLKENYFVRFEKVEAKPNKNQPEPGAMLTETADLEKELKQPGLRILDTRASADYTKGHIPGAFWVNVKSWQELAKKEGSFQDAKAWGEKVGQLGIGRDTPVVVYGSSLPDAARVWWTLKYLGVQKVSILNGGWDLWTKEKRQTDTDVLKHTGVKFEPKFQADRLEEIDSLKKSVQAGKVTIVDTRSTDEFTGKEVRGKRGGHIPGAKHLEWKELLAEDGRFKAPEQLRELFKQRGIQPDQTAVCY